MSVAWEVRQGSALERLREMPDESVQCCVTSPPYYGLRDYGAEGQIGLEATPDEFVAALVAVFAEVRRVLRADGTLWLNMGDSYCSTDKWGGGKSGNTGKHTTNGADVPSWAVRMRSESIPGVKPKDLLGVPWLLAFALRADGWYLRSDIIWAKPNPMPESVTDRPTSAHEHLFLLAKSPRYFYDAEAIREDDSGHPSGNGFAGRQDHRLSGGLAVGGTVEEWQPGGGRNKRNVWEIATQPYPDAHFATFPPKLVEPCILAGTSPKACGGCGAPWARLTTSAPDPNRPQAKRAMELAAQHELGPEHIAALQACGISDTGKALVTTNGTGKNAAAVQALADEARGALKGYSREFLIRGTTQTLGWEPTCEHDDDTGHSVILDPFAGAGTTGVVALRHGRSFVGIELNPAYAEMARWRIRDDAPLLNTPTEVAA